MAFSDLHVFSWNDFAFVIFFLKLLLLLFVFQSLLFVIKLKL